MDKVKFQANLRMLRKKHGWRQAEMEAQCGVTGATWSNYEKGVSEPTIWKLYEISKIFGISMEALLGVEEVAETEMPIQRKNIETYEATPAWAIGLVQKVEGVVSKVEGLQAELDDIKKQQPKRSVA